MKQLISRVLALVMALATLFCVPAFAAETTALPDTTSQRSLTIYKYDYVDETVPYGAGLFEEVNTTEHRPMKNVIFDIYYYGDLDTSVPRQISQEQAETWAASNASARKATIVTNEQGVGTWNAATGKSADGVYLVVERVSRAIQYTGKTMPFFISLPYTNPNEDGWIYQAVVQPKNQLVPAPDIEKDVTELGNDHESARIGELETWIIRADVPADLYYQESVGGAVTEFYADKYELVDPIDSKLDFKGHIRVTLGSGDGEDLMTLRAAEDYVLSGTAQEDKAGGELIINLTQAGMQEIMTRINQPGSTLTPDICELRVYFDTAINDTAIMGKNIPNNAVINYTNSTGLSYTAQQVPEENRPEIHTGGFKIEKVDIADPAKKLEGAEFHIATTEENALAGTWLKDAYGKDIVITTDESGTAEYKGLYYDGDGNVNTNMAERQPETYDNSAEAGTYYWMVETVAPEGYQLKSVPIQFAVNNATYTDTTVPYELTNATKYDLPRAGGDGMRRYLIIGVLAMGAAGAICAAAISAVRKKHS